MPSMAELYELQTIWKKRKDDLMMTELFNISIHPSIHLSLQPSNERSVYLTIYLDMIVR